MKLKMLFVSTVLIFCLLVGGGIKLKSHDASPPADYADNPPDLFTCSNCHSPNTVGDSTKFELLIGTDTSSLNPVVSGLTTWVPGTVYFLRFKALTTAPRYGFEITAEDSINGGTLTSNFAVLNGVNTTLQSLAGTKYIGHKNGNTNSQWTFKWTAPTTYPGAITFYYIGMNSNANNSNNGDNTYAANKTIRKYVPMSLSFSVSNPQTVCSGTSITLNPITANGTAPYSYAWSSSAGQLSCMNCQSPSITITQNTTFIVTVTDYTSATVTDTLTYNVFTPPNAAITAGNDTLTASSAYAYTWFLNDTAISGANAQVYVATQAGSYTVQVTDANGCTATSPAYNFSPVSAISTNSIDAQVSVSPNPANNVWQLKIAANLLGNEAELFDSDGRLVYRVKLEEALTTLDANLPSGIYYLKIPAKDQNIVRKLLKM